jgi:hypothetical protein
MVMLSRLRFETGSGVGTVRPGVTAGVVGPSPVAYNSRVSPGTAGLDVTEPPK